MTGLSRFVAREKELARFFYGGRSVAKKKAAKKPAKKAKKKSAKKKK